ncbi:hypothetical protein [Lysinibacillus xylanilyticus]|uniref:GNAT family N-acetyltransferase n=1 Tax=Lysinibacillus xylanilyticus TaxID=582475 RepID=A0ABT4EVY4_9BACI|nr:hypothetical protein [Lysinibacillus xylanilyticus]MCY9549838.1 hypothetical protein [Lysinibacillus xylanilyticus]
MDILNDFELPDEQSQFTALPKDISIDMVGQYPIVILSDNIPVGFFVLHATERVKEYSNNPKLFQLLNLF